MLKENKQIVYKNSFPVFGLAFLIMLALKLLGKIAISWWWVTSPLWIPLLIVIGIFIFLLLIAGVVTMFTK